MSCDEHNLLASVIHLTKERDKGSLIKMLVEVLSDLIKFDALILLQIPPGADGQYLEVAASVPIDAYQHRLSLIPHEYGHQRVQPDDCTSHCIQRREIISHSGGKTKRILFPVVVNNSVTGIVDIYGCHLSIYTENLIRNFVHIYSNFLAIIDDNEHDTLTGLLNRRTFDAQISKLLSTTENNTFPFMNAERRGEKKDAHHWVGLLDIDHFKTINDNYGHVYGDEVLILFADLMRKSFRNNDLLFRYGGEEFVVVLIPSTDADALMAFERFRQKVESIDFPQVGKVTVSIGIVKIDMQEHIATVLENADQSLYYAKDHGRNQICNYHELIKAGLIKERKIKNDIELF